MIDLAFPADSEAQILSNYEPLHVSITSAI